MSALARQDEFFSREQIETIKAVICPGITDNELKLFSEVCRQTKLSPFAKQIYVTKRATWDPELKQSVPKMTIQTGIDGFRLIAERTGKYRGQTAFQWCGADGVWRDVWLSDKPPAAARAGVMRSDFTEPLYRTARWAAYVQTKRDGSPTQMWSKMGPEQLAKCAEALALRTAFPQELSGLYTDDEMHQADNEPSRPAEVRATVVEPAPAQLPPPAADRSQPLPTRTAKNYAQKRWADVPFGSLPHSALAEYLTYYTEKLPEIEQPNHRRAVEATILAAQAEAQRRIDAEAAGADPETGEVQEDDDLPEGKGHQTFPIDAAGEPLT